MHAELSLSNPCYCRILMQLLLSWLNGDDNALTDSKITINGVYMKRKAISNTAARRRTLLKICHRRILNRQKLFFTFIQSQD